ncbi:MAG: SUMF1/EgtB/PvdO family nonheme iron enzyme, partial [Verrucomicrobia bacterium]|nr:SUMF1/EgtB/PvdO family nonheme iron enzyme [Verrucomicrobiota bacterium]
MKSIFLALLLTAASLSAADRVALVIGNNDYDDSGKLTDLRACRLDAQLIRRTLEAVGFTVILGEDQDRAGMDDLLTRFESTIPKGGTAVVYFAGHAIEFDGKNYLLGTNAKLQARSRLTEEAMNAETFASAMLLAGAKSSFLLLDCCRNAPTDSDWLTRGATRKAGLAQIDADGDIIIGYAAKPGASALEPAEPGSNSPYATALAKWIPSGFKHGDVFEKVRQEVNETTGGLQRTWENGSFLEPFYFVSTGKTPPAPAPMAVPAAPKLPALADRAQGATKDAPFVNSLGLEFIPLPGKAGVLMCRTETRVRDFERFVKATSHDATGGAYTLETGGWKQAGGTWKDPRFPASAAQTPDHPVTCVSWEDAQAFCAWLYAEEGVRYRLPTDEEWSLAVGLGKYPWGNEYPPPRGVGNYAGVEANTGAFKANNYPVIPDYDDGAERTAPVASYAANRFGFYDLGGNVLEWCEDWFRMSMNDPEIQKIYRDHGWNDGGGNKYRVLRGGSWRYGDSALLLSSGRSLRHACGSARQLRLPCGVGGWEWRLGSLTLF